MKKYFLSIVALAAMLFATSCQESLVEPQMEGPTTFTVQLPDAMGTKATIGGYELINRVYVEVYSADDTQQQQCIYKPTNEDGTYYFDTFDPSTNSATIRLNLIQDQAYDIVFWAQHGESYNVSDLRAVQMNNLHHNSETGAAFFAKLDNFTPGDNSNVELKRPFAQLNLGTTSESLITNAGQVTLYTAAITVGNVATTFNALEQCGEGERTITFIAEEVPSQILKVGEVEYKYISMDYLPIAGDAEALVTVNAEITLGNGQSISHEFTNVPVKENYRTNIVGNLISSTTDFVVKVNDDWAGPDYKYDSEDGKVYVEVGTVEELQNAINDGVDNITLTENIELTGTLVFGEIPGTGTNSIARTSTNETSFVLDLGGKTITTPVKEAGRHHYAIDNYANLTIVGEGAINARGIENFGTMTIDGNITITNVDTNGGAAIWNEGDITINGGTFTTNNEAGAGSYGAALNTRPGGKAIVNGGTFKANSQLTYAIINEGETIINNAIVEGRHGAVASAESCKTEIYGGSFEQTGVQGQSDHCTYFVSAIYGGKFKVEQPTDAGGQVFYKSNIADGYVAVEDNGVWTVSKANVVIGTKGYSSLQAAVDGVKSGETIKLIDNVTVSETSDPNGNVVYYTGDKSFTIDLNEKVLTGNTSNVVFRFQKSEGEVNTITIKNGTVEALKNTWSAISIGSSCSTKTFVNLEGLTIKSQKPNDMAVRARSGAEFTMKNCTVEATNSAGGICAGGGNVVLENVTVNQSGWYSSNWNSVALGISGGAKMTIKSGSYTSNPNDERGTWVAYVMSSGGTLEINGGTFNATVAETANAANACGVICADRAAVVNINGGTFNSNGAILDMRNNVGTQPNPVATLAGGDYSADPRVSGLYSSNSIKVAEGYNVVENNGRWIVSK